MSKKKFAGRLLLVVLTTVVLYQGWVLAHVWWWIDHNPSTSAFMEERLDIMQADDPEATLRNQWVPYNAISDNLKRAVMAGEDAKFLEHDGFDWEGIQTAWERDLKKGKVVAGGSTISQQLAKNLFLSGHRTPWRKLEEATITVMMEHLMTKRRILEIYLNVIEWGNGVFGAEAASEYYFHEHASALGSSQAAWMAAIIPNPRYYDLHRQGKSVTRKAHILQRRMQFVEAPE